MSRPIYYFDRGSTTYDFIDKGQPNHIPTVMDFTATPVESATLRRARCIMSSRSGQFQWKVLRVERKQEPTVDGRFPLRVTALRLMEGY